VDTITASHGYRANNDKGLDIATYHLSRKVKGRNCLFALMSAHGEPSG
jgi:hypothetical protein